MENSRVPFSVKNTRNIPKPSRLAQPSILLPRKRPLTTSPPQDEGTVSQGKENKPVVKRAKLSSEPNVKSVVLKTVSKSRTATGVQNGSSKLQATRASTFLTKAAPKKATVTATSSRTKIATAPPTKKSTTNGKPTRPGWDIKGQLVDMANDQKTSSKTINDLQGLLNNFSGRLNELEKIKEEQEGAILVKQEECTTASTQIKDLKDKLVSTTRKLETARESKTYLEGVVSGLESNLTSSKAEVFSLKEAITQTTANMSAVQCELEATKIALGNTLKEGVDKSNLIAELRQDIQDHLSTIDQCQSRIREDETGRRKLHNTIQELKGNIRVFCRVRPFLPTDPGYFRDSLGRESSISSCGSNGSSKRTSTLRTLSITYPDKDREKKKLSLELLAQEKGKKSHDFDFDQVFGPNSTQDNIFFEISQLVQSALDGYNVCIFAYGQTGSGKTFTMEGPKGKVLLESGIDSRGMIPRAVEQVFSSAIEMREKGWEYKMEASFLEIYNETLRDLLAPSSSSANSQIDVKIDPSRHGEVYVTNITPCVITSVEQVKHLLERAGKNRAVAATQCNERSSRSHSVFILKISGQNESTGESCQGVLNMVDLAGSERLSQSGSEGERLKETKNINKSLSNLGNVIMALSNKDNHIPYRNSKLTYLLQNSLGGNSKTLMFVNMSPQLESYQETLCSLRFATMVNQCNIGTAQKTTK